MKLLVFILLLVSVAFSQAPPRSDSPSSAREQGESSSKDTKIDVAAPVGDAVDHPESEDVSGTGEFKPWNPHKAMKDVEVGDYYFKRKNYRAAISRYREALEYKPKDAIATFKLAQALENNGQLNEAAQNYRAYLQILPRGPSAEDCKKALARLNSSASR
jgi:tetratricopeptide (TPR) repeat protein